MNLICRQQNGGHFISAQWVNLKSISGTNIAVISDNHDDVIKGNIFRVAVPSWRGPLMFSLICAWINGSENNRGAYDLRRHHAHYDVTVMNDLTLEWDVVQFKLGYRQIELKSTPQTWYCDQQVQPHTLLATSGDCCLFWTYIREFCVADMLYMSSKISSACVWW